MLVSLLFPGAFAAYGSWCWYFNISYRVSIVAGIVLLIVTALFVTIGLQDHGNFVGILVYFFLLVGVALAFIEWRRETLHNDEEASYESLEEPNGRLHFSFHSFVKATHPREPRRR